ncbi:acyl-CoA carboxylase subunit epsilon [Phycicoccus sp. CSK15P-2]|uniref:acyl-CoA carboxylase epsilon subunit n=1 Tax=Phycicoccus sp. CSK15P-2 TaxID=2807627 RepID=UPI0019508459|nr:acyl-CoA carboxylase epsilon subunit [Phycicoccus sp. CSK15P-2]MBM6402924.1 acyl-CoA carboxylase subunit epsilon [Phycicoccus sp. CSK15P-2]
MATDERAERPAIRVEGGATAEEVAAVVAVLAATGGAPDAPDRPSSSWASHRALLRHGLAPGPGAWQWTYRR